MLGGSSLSSCGAHAQDKLRQVRDVWCVMAGKHTQAPDGTEDEFGRRRRGGH